MATSEIGKIVGELYSKIQGFQSEIDAVKERHKAELEEKYAELKKTQSEFNSYLTQVNVTVTNIKGEPRDLFGNIEQPKAERKQRAKSDDVKANVALAKSVFTSSYELGIDEKTGLPKRHKGRNRQENVDIDRMMNDDAAAAGYKVVLNEGRRELVKLYETYLQEATEAKPAKATKKGK